MCFNFLSPYALLAFEYAQVICTCRIHFALCSHVVKRTFRKQRVLLLPKILSRVWNVPYKPRSPITGPVQHQAPILSPDVNTRPQVNNYNKTNNKNTNNNDNNNNNNNNAVGAEAEVHWLQGWSVQRNHWRTGWLLLEKSVRKLLGARARGVLERMQKSVFSNILNISRTFKINS